MISISPGIGNPVGPAVRPTIGAWGGRRRARVIAFLGDSITGGNSVYSYRLSIGAGTSQILAYMMPGYEATGRYGHVVAGNNTPLSVAVNGADVTVNLATNGSGVATSTAAQVEAAVRAVPSAWAIVRPYAQAGGAGVAAAAALANATANVSAFPSFAYTAQWLLRGRFELARRMTVHNGVAVTASAWPGNFDFGYAGYRADQLDDAPGPLGDVLASDADTVLVLAGTNDTPSNTAAQIRDEVTAIWDLLRAAGKRVIAAQITWRNDANQTKVAETNPLLEAAAAERGIPFWKHDTITGTANFPDGVHPGLLGGYRLGQSLAGFLASRVSTAEYVFPAADDPAWITANPYMAGGTTTATGWTAGTTPSGGSCVMSKVGDWQQATVTQSGPGVYNSNFPLFQNNVPIAGKAVAGDTVRAVAEVEMDAGADYKNLQLAAVFNPSKGSTSTMANGGSVNISAMTAGIDPFTGILLSSPTVIPAGTTDVSFQFQFYGAGVVRIRKAGLLKVS